VSARRPLGGDYDLIIAGGDPVERGEAHKISHAAPILIRRVSDQIKFGTGQPNTEIAVSIFVKHARLIIALRLIDNNLIAQTMQANPNPAIAYLRMPSLVVLRK
jgi:hypothetical protein